MLKANDNKIKLSGAFGCFRSIYKTINPYSLPRASFTCEKVPWFFRAFVLAIIGLSLDHRPGGIFGQILWQIGIEEYFKGFPPFLQMRRPKSAKGKLF